MRTADELHRLAKLLMDEHGVASWEQAEAAMRKYRVCVRLGRDVAASKGHQAALLTIANCARRAFLGGVQVVAPVDVLEAPVLVPVLKSGRLGDALTTFGATLRSEVDDDLPTICLGETRGLGAAGFEVHATFDGWCGGVVPSGDERLPESQDFAPAAALAGAIAVGEAFQHILGDAPFAGRRSAGISLWRPDMAWQRGDARGPELGGLPTQLWLIGLGNLGQAYLWLLGMLPYAQPDQLRLVLQDFDRLVPANESTSVLTEKALVGSKKTRVCARWAEDRGFKTEIVERRFGKNLLVDDDDPPTALCGVDNMNARALLESVGFARVIEAGLGTGGNEYLAFQLHSFPGSRTAQALWATPRGEGQVLPLAQPAYEALRFEGVDQCGLVEIARRSVGAPFVGVTAAGLVIAEVLRPLHGGPRFDVIDGTLRSLGGLTAIPLAPEHEPHNPGVTVDVGV